MKPESTDDDNCDHFNSLIDHFLISMPSLENSIFNHSVTYICDHTQEGAMGIIINQPMPLTLGEVFEQFSLNVDPKVEHAHVLAGGPVNTQQGLVLHRDQGQWDSTMHVTPEICVTASKDIIEAMAKNQAPASAQLALGYAGWSEGQLEQELQENCWLTMPAQSSILFDTPSDQRWSAAAKHLGVNLDLISSQKGHA